MPAANRKTSSPAAARHKRQLAADLRAWRKRHRLSQSEAATRLGISIDTLQNWEISRCSPRGFGLIALKDKIKK